MLHRRCSEIISQRREYNYDFHSRTSLASNFHSFLHLYRISLSLLLPYSAINYTGKVSISVGILGRIKETPRARQRYLQ